MIHWLLNPSRAIVIFAAILANTAVLGATQATPQKTQSASDQTSHVSTINLNGDWQMSWQARLGAEQCILHLEQSGAKLTGTLKSLRGISLLSGTVDEKGLSFDVQFQGPHPFTTRFVGVSSDSKLEGTSHAIGVGGAGAFLGHAGEVTQPEHPWSAKPVTNRPAS